MRRWYSGTSRGQFLARNEFDHLEQLRDLECEPGLWLGAKILTDGEIDFVKRMAYTLAEDPVKRVHEQLQCYAPVNASCDMGPRSTLKSIQLDKMDSAARNKWLREAKLDSIVSSCRLSLPSVRSGIRCFAAFMAAAYPDRQLIFPPSLECLLQWSALFRCKNTFANYLGYLRTACLLVDEPTEVLDHPAIKRAKLSTEKSSRFAPRPKLWIQQAVVERLVLLSEQHVQWKPFARLWVLAYAFLCRVPSEALPIVAGKSRASENAACRLVIEGTKIALHLKRRKNRPQGSVLVRSCWCKQSARTCPFHTFAPVLDAARDAEPLFFGFSSHAALQALREMLRILKVKDADLYRTHDLRRGHALDLQLSGAPLYEILQAGEWRSPAFLQYLDMHRLETCLVVQAHCDDSDADE